MSEGREAADAPPTPEAAVRAWNAEHPVGTLVAAWPGTRDEAPRWTRIRTPAWLLGSGTPVVSVDGYAGGIALTHIEVVPLAALPPVAGPEVRPDETLRALHRPVKVQVGSKTHGGGPQYADICQRDRNAWPCEVATLSADLAEARALLAAAPAPAPGDEGLRAENDAARRMLADERAAVSALEGRLDKIAEWHHKEADEQGGTYGSCFECGMPWPCATSRWATDNTAEANCTWELDDCAFPEHNNHTIRAALASLAPAATEAGEGARPGDAAAPGDGPTDGGREPRGLHGCPDPACWYAPHTGDHAYAAPPRSTGPLP